MILATGGYAGNRDLMARWPPVCVNIPNGCYLQDYAFDDYGFTCISATVFGYAVGRDVALS